MGLMKLSIAIVALPLACSAGEQQPRDPGETTTLSWVVVAHDISMLILTLFLIGHLYFTYVYKAIGGMTNGWVEEVDARLEHPKWVEEMEAEAATAAMAAEADTE